MGKIMPPHTQEWKDSQSKRMKGRLITWGAKISESEKCKIVSDISKKKMSKARLSLPPDKRVRNSKLSPEMVIQIKKEYKEGKTTQKKLGAKYGVSDVMISNIVRGKNWTFL